MKDKVHLFDLKERTSASGNRYLSGWLGKSLVVAFLDKDAAEPTWQVFVSTPTPKHGERSRGSRQGSARGEPVAGNDDWRRDVAPQSAAGSRGSRQVEAGVLDDAIYDVGARYD